MSDATLWKQYVGAYHDFWDYLEENEEVLQKEKNVNQVRCIMEECPVINFSCVRDLTYTMRQFLGEKRFKKIQWRDCLESKIEECIKSVSSRDEGEFWAYKWMADLEMKVNSNTFPEERLTRYEMELCIATVQEEFTRKADHLVEKQERLRKISDWSYNNQVYGQDIYRQQALILNFNILHTFCHNLVIYYHVNPSNCDRILRMLVREAFDPEVTGIQIQIPDNYVPPWADCYDVHAQFSMETRITIWPLHEPVVSSYDDRKVALSQRLGNSEHLKFMPPIYIPQVQGEIVSFLKTTGDEGTKEVNLDSILHKIVQSRHFAWVMEILQSEKYYLNHNETDPTRKSNWLYYCVMFDPTVSPEAADQGYIGMTTRYLVTRWKEHVRLKDKSVIQYNLALVSQYAWLRGEDLSEYVAVFALGTTAASRTLGTVKGKLIRETSEGGFTVGNMKYGMNDKRAAQKD